MKIIYAIDIAKFLEKNPESSQFIACWSKIIETGEWKNFEKMLETFPKRLKREGKVILFKIGCGRYIVKTRINFNNQQVIVRDISMDADYDREKQQIDTKELH